MEVEQIRIDFEEELKMEMWENVGDVMEEMEKKKEER